MWFQEGDLLYFFTHLTPCNCGWQLHGKSSVKNFDITSHFQVCMETSHMQWPLDFFGINRDLYISNLTSWFKIAFVFTRWWSFYPLLFSTHRTTLQIASPVIFGKVICCNYSLLLLVFHYEQFIKRTRPRRPWSRIASKFRKL